MGRCPYTLGKSLVALYEKSQHALDSQMLNSAVLDGIVQVKQRLLSASVCRDDGGGGTVEDLLGEEGYADDAYAADYEDANAEQAAVENGRAESAALPEEQETQASQPAVSARLRWCCCRCLHACNGASSVTNHQTACTFSSSAYTNMQGAGCLGHHSAPAYQARLCTAWPLLRSHEIMHAYLASHCQAIITLLLFFLQEAPGSASKRSVPAAYFEDVGAQSSHQGQGRAGPGPGSMHTNANFQQGSHFSADSRGGRHPNGEQFGQGRGRGMTGQGVNGRFGYGQHMQPFVEGPNGPNGGRGRGMMGGRHSPGPMGMGHQPGHVQGRMGGMMPSAGGMQNAGMMGGMHGVPMRPAIGRMGPGAPGPHDVAMRQQQALMQQMMSGECIQFVFLHSRTGSRQPSQQGEIPSWATDACHKRIRHTNKRHV